jgi:hypothetical protein
VCLGGGRRFWDMGRDAILGCVALGRRRFARRTTAGGLLVCLGGGRLSWNVGRNIILGCVSLGRPRFARMATVGGFCLGGGRRVRGEGGDVLLVGGSIR